MAPAVSVDLNFFLFFFLWLAVSSFSLGGRSGAVLQVAPAVDSLSACVLPPAAASANRLGETNVKKKERKKRNVV